MKCIKKIIFAAVFFAVAFQTDSVAVSMSGTGSDVQVVQPAATNVDQVLTVEREKIEQLTIDTEKIKVAARMAINDAQNKLEKDEISPLEAAKIIGEQNYKIEQAERQLAEFVKKSVEDVQEAENQEQSYMSRFMTGVQDIGARMLAPFKSGYGYTEQEKGIARSIIAELNKQLEEMRTEYEEKIQEATSNEEKDKLNFDYKNIEQEFKNEIYEQKLITGDEMSTNRKLFWGAVGTAGAVMGGVITKQYLGAEVPLTLTPQQKTIRDINVARQQEKIVAAEREHQKEEVEREKAFERMEAKYKRQQEIEKRKFGMSAEERELLSVHPEAFEMTTEAVGRVKKMAEEIPAPEALEKASRTPEFGLPLEERESLPYTPVSYGPAKEALKEKPAAPKALNKASRESGFGLPPEGQELLSETPESFEPGVKAVGEILLSAPVSEYKTGGDVIPEEYMKAAGKAFVEAPGKISKRAIEAEQYRGLEEEPFGASEVSEAPESYGRVKEEVSKAAGEAARRPLNPEEGI